MIDVFLPLSSNIEEVCSVFRGGVINTKATISPGGAANVAVHLSKLGGKAAFTGKVGNDYFGRIFIDDLDQSGVSTNVSMSRSKNTGMVFTLVFSNGERSFIVDRGANIDLEYEDIDLSLIQRTKYLYFTGFSVQDEQAWECIQKVLRQYPEGAHVVFNPGAPNLAKDFRSTFAKIIKEHVDILILNECEGSYLTDHSSEAAILNSLLSLVPIVALTKGERGSITATSKGVHNIKADTVKVVDTTGAGDAYAAGFIYGLSRGWKEEEAGELASRIAEKVVSHVGARTDPLLNYNASGRGSKQ